VATVEVGDSVGDERRELVRTLAAEPDLQCRRDYTRRTGQWQQKELGCHGQCAPLIQ
jgi:hypothetical protein